MDGWANRTSALVGGMDTFPGGVLPVGRANGARPVPDVKRGTFLRYGGCQSVVACDEREHPGDARNTLPVICGNLRIDVLRGAPGEAESRTAGWNGCDRSARVPYPAVPHRSPEQTWSGLTMLYRVGRILQICGMLILPQAIVLELLGRVTLGQSLLIAAGGTGLFLVGVSLQRAGR